MKISDDKIKSQKFQCDLCHEYFRAVHKISLSTKHFHMEHNLCNRCFENIKYHILRNTP